MISNDKRDVSPRALLELYSKNMCSHKTQVCNNCSAFCMVATMQTLVCIVVTMPTYFPGSYLFVSFPNIIGLYQLQRLARPDILPLLTICYRQFDSWTCDAVAEIGTNAVLYRVV